MLATVNPKHRYFEPGYAPETCEKVEEPVEEIQVNNNDNFFTHLKAPKRSAKKKGRNIFVSKLDREMAKFTKMEKRGIDLHNKI